MVLACFGALLLPSEEQADLGFVGNVYSGDCRYVDGTDTVHRALLAVLLIGVLTAIT